MPSADQSARTQPGSTEAAAADASSSLPSSLSSERKPAAIGDDLPVEILLMIFKDVYRLVRGHDEFLDRSPTQEFPRFVQGPPTFWRESDDLFSPALFPESLARVCPKWREIMSGVPAFWSRLVIFIDDEPTLLSIVRSYVDWSKDEPLDIHILRRSGKVNGDPAEGDYITAVMQLLIPHIRRWRCLRANVVHAASLPIPRIDFFGEAPLLTDLRLEFAIDDAVLPPDEFHFGHFDTPVLATLHLGGVAFRAAYTLEASLPPTVKNLSVVGYESAHPSFRVVDLAAAITRMAETKSLRLADLALDCSYSGPPLDREDWDEVSITFEGMDGAALSEFHRLLSYPWLFHATYKNCSLDEATFEAHSLHLTLEDIASPQSILDCLTAWDGDTCHYLNAHGCEGLTSTVFQCLSHPSVNDTWLCRCMASLQIDHCTNFTSHDIREMVEARQFDEGFAVMSLEQLSIINGPQLALEDKVWLEDNLGWFNWNHFQGGYEYRRTVKTLQMNHQTSPSSDMLESDGP